MYQGQPEKYKILFIEKLPSNVTYEHLESIFAGYTGLVEVRQITERGYAFVEYLTDEYAAFALQDIKAGDRLTFDDPETGLKVEAKINFGKR